MRRAALSASWAALIIISVTMQTAHAQTLYSIGTPTSDQQYMLELINRARANGTVEALRLGLSGLQEGPPSVGGQPWTFKT